MGKCYCDYCDVFLTHDSVAVRKQHNDGNRHKQNVCDYYRQFIGQKTQRRIDEIVADFERKVLFGLVRPSYGVPSVNGAAPVHEEKTAAPAPSAAPNAAPAVPNVVPNAAAIVAPHAGPDAAPGAAQDAADGVPAPPPAPALPPPAPAMPPPPAMLPAPAPAPAADAWASAQDAGGAPGETAAYEVAAPNGVAAKPPLENGAFAEGGYDAEAEGNLPARSLETSAE